jgi:hypothetical protein
MLDRDGRFIAGECSRGQRPPLLDDVSSGKADEHYSGAAGDVDHVVVRGRDDGERHR